MAHVPALYRYGCSCSDGALTLCRPIHPCWAMLPGWAWDGRLLSLRRLLWRACLKVLALHCGNMMLLGARTQISFPDYRDGNWSSRDGCCGHHPSLRERVHCFSNSSAGSQAGSRLWACCFLFLALHCGDMILLPGVQMLIVLPGCRDGLDGS